MRADTPHFSVFAENSTEELTDIAVSLEQFDANLRQWLKLAPEGETSGRLSIYLLKNRRQVADLANDADRRTTGFYRPSAAGSFIVAYHDEDGTAVEQGTLSILFHEYTHHLMTRELSVVFPAWLEEGAAEYFGNMRFLKSGQALPVIPLHRFQGDIRWMPMARLFSLSGSDLRGSMRETFYRQSWLLFAYLRTDPARSAQLGAYLDHVRIGASPDVARLAFGDVDGLYNQVLKFLRDDIEMKPIAASAPMLRGRAIIVPLPAAEVALLPYRIAMQIDPAAIARTPGMLANVKRLAAENVGSVEAQRFAAEAMLGVGQTDDALASIDRALLLDPSHQRAMLLKGQIKAAALRNAKSASDAEWKEARSWIFKANRADTEDALPLIAYYFSFEQQGIKPPEVAFAALTKAYDLVPEDPSVRLAYGIAMILQGQRAEAIHALTILANAPHDSGVSIRASELLAKLK